MKRKLPTARDLLVKEAKEAVKRDPVYFLEMIKASEKGKAPKSRGTVNTP